MLSAVKFLKYIPHTMDMVLDFCFELLDIYTINLQKTVGFIVV